MNGLDDNQKKFFLTIQILAIAIFVFSPIMFLVVANFVQITSADFDSIQLLQYVFLFFSLVLPSIAFFVKRGIIFLAWKKQPAERRPEQFYLTVFLICAPLVEAIYVFGLIIYFLSGDIQKMLYFYPIGIIWTFIFWPTRGRFGQFISEFKTR